MKRLIASLGGAVIAGASAGTALAAASTPLTALTPHGPPAASDLIPIQPVAGPRLLSSTAGDVRNYVLTSFDAFGADPTGVADSTAAIQAAINSGLSLTCQGIYKTTAPLLVETYASNGQTIRGGGSWGQPGASNTSVPPPGACMIKPTSAVTSVFVVDGTPAISSGYQTSWIQGFSLENIVIDMGNMADDSGHVAVNQIQAWDGHYSQMRVINDGNNKRGLLLNGGAFTTTINQPWMHIIDLQGTNASYEVTTITINNPDVGKLLTNWASSVLVNGGAFQHPYIAGVTTIVWVPHTGLGAYSIGFPAPTEGFYGAVGTDIKNSQFITFVGTDFEAASQPPVTCVDAGGWLFGTYNDGIHGCAPIIPVELIESTAFDTLADSLSFAGVYPLDQGVGSSFPGLSQNGVNAYSVSRHAAQYYTGDVRVIGKVEGPIGFTGALGNESGYTYTIDSSTGFANFRKTVLKPASDGIVFQMLNASNTNGMYYDTTGNGTLSVPGQALLGNVALQPLADSSFFFLKNAAGQGFMICSSNATIGLSNCAVGAGADWAGFSDTSFSTRTYDLDAATGNGTFTGTVTTGLLKATTSMLSAGTGGVGYAPGAGGTVTQPTSRTTGVTLNKTTGAITLFSAAGSTTPATFTVTDSTVAATDTVTCNQKFGANAYLCLVTAVATGSFSLTVYTTGGTTSEAPVLNFTVTKGAIS